MRDKHKKEKHNQLAVQPAASELIEEVKRLLRKPSWCLLHCCLNHHERRTQSSVLGRFRVIAIFIMGTCMTNTVDFTPCTTMTNNYLVGWFGGQLACSCLHATSYTRF